MNDSDVKLGYIGLGNMGAPMAKRMVDWPGGLTVFDIRTEAMTPLAEAGARLADRVSDLAAADIISVTVLNDEQVREVVGELAGLAKPDTVIAIHSTISDTTAVELAKELQRQGIHVVDAPVSGGGGAAEKGELATMVGAEREVYERIKPVFKQWASMVIHAGEPGAGTRMKLARNMLTFTSYAAACEAMRLAEAAGLDLQALGRAGEGAPVRGVEPPMEVDADPRLRWAAHSEALQPRGDDSGLVQHHGVAGAEQRRQLMEVAILEAALRAYDQEPGPISRRDGAQGDPGSRKLEIEIGKLHSRRRP